MFGRTPPWLRSGLLVVVALGMGAGVGVFAVYFQGLPSIADLEGYRPSLVTKIYANDGETIIGEFFEQKRLPVRLHQVPPHLLDAVISTEDRRFREHSGIDLVGILRAVIADLRSMSVDQGASTITQQLARNLFLSHERVFSRKIREALLAFKIERTYSKDEILELYLNQIYFGHGAYGLEAASRRFFSKHVEDLDLAEATLLAGLPGSPTRFSPIEYPDNALGRRRVVLRSMVSHGVLSREVADSTGALPLELTTSPRQLNQAPYFVEWVRRWLKKKDDKGNPAFSDDQIYREGLRVYTTLNPRLQKIAERCVIQGLDNQEQREEYEVNYQAHHDSLEAGSSVVIGSPYVQGALLSADPKTGAILAMVGGRDFEDSEFNRAVQARRQVGSLFKPFVFTQALRDGRTPADVIVDGPIVMDTGAKTLWEPRNYHDKFYGPITLRDGLKNSRNLMTIRLALDLGIPPIIELARDLGIESFLPNVPSLAIGSGDITLWELSRAYTAYANRGVVVDLHGITRIEDARGRVLFSHSPIQREVLTEAETFVITDMLRSVLDDGTGRTARSLGFRRPAAGKTGTTDDFVDAWFMGYTPDLLAGVWVGFDDRTSLGKRQSGGTVALPIWTEYMKGATQGVPAMNFPTPNGVTSAEVCPRTGLGRGVRCPNGLDEIFLSGTEPAEECRHPFAATEDGDDIPSGDAIGLEF